MEVHIRKVKQGDADTLAYIQTESWKAAFKGIIDADMLDKCTNIDKARLMYQRLLDENKGNGYLLTVDNKLHCIAYWDETRDLELAGKAEIICIHSLPNQWRKGYGSKMMDTVLHDIAIAGYRKVMLWVFKENIRARQFYERHGFRTTGKEKLGIESTEICYEKKL